MNFESKILNSQVSETAQLYRAVDIINSSVEKNCVVGDFSRVQNSHLHSFVRIDRQNLIYHSEIGFCSYTGRNDTVMHSKIGRFCSLSWNITVGAGEHDYKRLTTHDFLYNDFYGLKPKNIVPYERFEANCEIANDVWIGASTVVLRGVKIGNGAVIGANSVVTKDIPPYAIAAGNPAKILKLRFEKDIIEELEKLCWWNLPLQVIKENYNLFNKQDIMNSINKLKNITKIS